MRRRTPGRLRPRDGDLAQPPVRDHAAAQQQPRHPGRRAGVEGLRDEHVDDRLAERRRDVRGRQHDAVRLGALDVPGDGRSSARRTRSRTGAARGPSRRSGRAGTGSAAGSPPSGGAVDRRAAGVRQAEQPRDLVERLPRRVVEGLARASSTSWTTSRTSSRDVCPPDTSRATVGSSTGRGSSPGAWRRSAVTCPTRWFTPCSGLPAVTASAFAAPTPTMSAPASPGPAVTATASRSAMRDPRGLRARARASGRIASRCARAAISGTTPPYRACSSTEEAMTFASTSRPRTIPTPVSSQERLDAEDERAAGHAAPPPGRAA